MRAHVEEPVVLSHHHFYGRLNVFQNLRAEIELLSAAELREIAAKKHKVRLRIEGVDVLHGFNRGADEAVVHIAGIKMRVGNIGDRERRYRWRGVGDLNKLETLRNDEALCRRYS